VKNRGLFRYDFILLVDTEPLPSGGEETPVFKAQSWYRCGDCGSFDFGNYTNAIPEEKLDNQEFLSIACASRVDKSVGVIRYALTA
ncbi:MAG: hypothetical protein V1813_03865, partial [Candidatus Aenigmatarchaeota archaeon]